MRIRNQFTRGQKTIGATLIRVSRVKDSSLRPLLHLFLRPDIIDGVFTTEENGLKAKSFPKAFIDLIRQGDVLTFRQSSLIDVDPFYLYK